MKKSKLFRVLILCVAFAMCFGLFAACGGTEEETHTTHTDEDGDGYCDVCGELISDSDDGDEDGDEDTVLLTDGYYSRSLSSTRTLLIKFYEADDDGVTYFYAEAATGEAYKGIYEVKSEELSFLTYTDEGIPYGEDEDGYGWLTADTAIYFYEDDGTTEFAINNSNYYADGTAENVLALYEDCLIHAKIEGAYSATRVLTHASEADFDTDDEVSIEKYKFMLASTDDIPEGATFGDTVQDYTFVITQNSFKTNITSTDDSYTEGSYSYADNVYDLYDDLFEEDFGTLTITDTGATYLSEDQTVSIDLVEYEEAEEEETSGTTEVSVWTGTADVYLSAYDATITSEFTLTFYSDFTAELIVSVNSSEMTVATLTWSLSESGYTIYFEDSSNGEFSAFTLSSDGMSVVWSGDISDSLTGVTVTLTGDVSDLAALQAVEVAGTSEVSVWSGETTFTVYSYEMTATFTLTFYSDFTAELICSAMGSEMTAATLTWSLSESGYTIYFEDSSNGEFSDFTLSSDGMSVVWSGDVSDSMTGIKVTLTGDVNDLSALQAVEAVEEEVTTVTTFTGETTFTVYSYEMTATFTLTFYSDCSVELVCSAMGSEMTAATATWSMPSTYSLSISDSSNGEFGDCTLSSDGITVTWSGDVSDSMTEIEVTLTSADDMSTTLSAFWAVA